jgi:flavin-dependent dehydrogenase
VTGPTIVGGGLAGAAAAALLARAGRKPLVLEREAGPHDKICGEFLSSEAQAHLAALGLDAAALGGVPTHGVRIVAADRQVDSRLGFVALGLTRHRLDEALLVHAEALGAKVERGVAVRGVEAAAGASPSLETSAGSMASPQILLASGKHDIRGARRKAGDDADEGDMVGFKTYFRAPPAQIAAMEGHVEVVLFDGGYAGLQTVEDGRINLCLVVRRAALHEAGRSWPGLMSRLLREPHLARRLDDAEALLPRPLTISNIPYGFMHREGGAGSGVWRLGDQAAVIPSFSGDGMAIALHSARLAAQALIEGADAGTYHARLRADVGRQVALALWLQRRAEGWPGRGAVLRGLGLLPGGVARLAAWTRVPQVALRRAGL